MVGQSVCKGDLEDPKDKEIYPRWRPRVPGPIEGRFKNHSKGVKEKAVRNNTYRIGGKGEFLRFGGKNPGDLLGEHNEQETDRCLHNTVVESGLPDRLFGALRLSRAEILADKSSRRIRQSNGRK